MFSMSRMFSCRDEKYQCYRFIILICTRGSEQMDTLYNLTPHAEFICHVTTKSVRRPWWVLSVDFLDIHIS